MRIYSCFTEYFAAEWPETYAAYLRQDKRAYDIYIVASMVWEASQNLLLLEQQKQKKG